MLLILVSRNVLGFAEVTEGLVDMINMIKLGFVPHACCWVHKKGKAQALLAVYVLHNRTHTGSGTDTITGRKATRASSESTMVGETRNHF